MRTYIVDGLVWVAAKLNTVANTVFEFAVRLTVEDEDDHELKDVTDEVPATSAPTEEPEPEKTPMKSNPLNDTLVKATLPVFTGTNNEPIPPSFDELPDIEIFRMMFERKYGRGGLCSMTIGGQPKLFKCEVLYELLRQIITQDDSTPMHLAVYGTTMSVIMHAHGEVFDPKELN